MGCCNLTKCGNVLGELVFWQHFPDYRTLVTARKKLDRRDLKFRKKLNWVTSITVNESSTMTGGIPSLNAFKDAAGKNTGTKENSLCSAVAMSRPFPQGQQIRTGGRETRQERTGAAVEKCDLKTQDSSGWEGLWPDWGSL